MLFVHIMRWESHYPTGIWIFCLYISVPPHYEKRTEIKDVCRKSLDNKDCFKLEVCIQIRDIQIALVHQQKDQKAEDEQLGKFFNDLLFHQCDF